MEKYRLLREEDGKYLIEEEFDSVESIYEWSKDIMCFFNRKGWV